MKQHVVAFLCVSLFTASCKKVEKKSSQELSQPQRVVEACSLLSKEEVGEIQNARMTDPQSSRLYDKNLLTSQCYYGSIEPDASVSLLVIQRGEQPGATRTAQDLWHSTFDSKDDEKEKERREQSQGETGEKESTKLFAQKIEGLGDEAYWVPTPVGGMLYVLRHSYMLRVSVGGRDSAALKQEKSKSLARTAVGRL